MNMNYKKCLATIAPLLMTMTITDGNAQIGESDIISPVGNIFNDTQRLSDNDLSELRGGFLFAGGLKIDFGIVSSTSIGGEIRKQVEYNTRHLVNLGDEIRKDVQESLANSGIGADVSQDELPETKTVQTTESPSVAPTTAKTGENNNINTPIVNNIVPEIEAIDVNIPEVRTSDLGQLGDEIRDSIDIPPIKGDEVVAQNDAAVKTTPATQPTTFKTSPQIASNPQVVSSADGLNTTIQLGDNNDFSGINDISGISTVIRNTLDDQVIQNSNIVDIAISGAANFKILNDLNILQDQNILALQ